MEAVVLAGGLGTRLAHIVPDRPKPMAPVAGKPFLEFILEELVRNGVNHIILAVCYRSEIITGYFGTGFRGVPIEYSVETSPLKTGGAIKKAISLCREERVLIVNGDTFYQIPLKEMHWFAEKSHKAVVIAAKEMTDFSRYGCMDIGENGLITRFREKEFCHRGYINGGIYDMKKTVLERYPEIFSLEEDAFPQLLKQKEIMAFPSEGYFIDIGIPEDYRRAQEDFQRSRA